MSEWIPVGKYGLRYREDKNRLIGVGKSRRPARYYVCIFKWQGRTTTDRFGWEGTDFKNLDEIVKTTLELRQNRRNMTPPFTLKEMLEQRQTVLDEIGRQRGEEEAQQKRENDTILDYVFRQYCEMNTHKISLTDEISYYKNWIGPTIGRKRLDQIVLFDLQRIQKSMEKAGKAPRSIGYIKSIVRQIYHYASEHKIYSGEIPTDHFLKKQQIDNRRQRYLSADESEALLDDIRRHSMTTYRISLLSLNSGMRFSEIAGLQWQHVDTTTRKIKIMDPKNLETRTVPMTERVLAMFQEMQPGPPDDLIYPATNGRRMGRISNVFMESVDRLGLNTGITDRRLKVCFHSLRHSCASTLVNAGIEIPVIARVLGHKTLAMTMRYSHVNDKSVNDAMAVLDQQQAERKKVLKIKQNK